MIVENIKLIKDVNKLLLEHYKCNTKIYNLYYNYNNQQLMTITKNTLLDRISYKNIRFGIEKEQII